MQKRSCNLLPKRFQPRFFVCNKAQCHAVAQGITTCHLAMRLQQYAAKRNISLATAKRWWKQGLLNAKKVGRVVIIDDDEPERIQASVAIQPPTPTPTHLAPPQRKRISHEVYSTDVEIVRKKRGKMVDLLWKMPNHDVEHVSRCFQERGYSV